MSRLVELLREDFGAGFPVQDGSATRIDPLIITEERDYVSIEHHVAQLCLDAEDLEYELESQQLRTEGGVAIDELVYAAKPKGSPEWTQTRRFFFDITAGYRRLGSK